MAIDEITADPDENDPSTIAIEIDLFVSQIKTAIPQINSSVAALNFNSTNSTSSDSLTVGTGTQNLTIETGKSWLPGMPITIARTSAGATTYMRGICVTYDSGTGALEASIDTKLGSGTYTDWSISFGVQVDPMRPGTEVLIAEITASGASIIDVEDDFDSYDRYIIRTDNLYSSVNGTDLNVRIKTGGSYQNAGYGYWNGGSVFASQSQITLDTMRNAENRNSVVALELYRPSNTTIYPQVRFEFATFNAGVLESVPVIGYGTNNQNAGPVQGIRLYGTTGTLTGGIKLYGVVS